MEIKIRKAIPNDALQLQILNEKFNGNCGVTSQMIEHSIATNDCEKVFVAEIDNVVVAFCCTQIFQSFCYGENYAEITEIYVDDSFRKTGIGTKLITYVEDYLKSKEIKSLILKTGENNFSAQAFYERNEWEKSGEITYRKRY